MECKDIYNDLLVDLLEGVLSPEITRNIHAHLSVCSKCRQRYARIKAVCDNLRHLPEMDKQVVIPVEVDNAISRQIPEIVASFRASSIKPARHIIRFVAAAAVLVIAFVGWLAVTSRYEFAKSPVSYSLKQQQAKEEQMAKTIPASKIPKAEKKSSSVNAQPIPVPLQRDAAPRTQRIEPVVPVVTPLKGDINKDGKIDIADSMLICQYLLGERELPEMAIADVNGDNKVDIADSLLIARKVSSGG